MALQEQRRTWSGLDVARPSSHAVKRAVQGVRRFYGSNTLSAIAGTLGVLLILIAIAAPAVAPKDPLKADFKRLTSAPTLSGPFSPFGTDQLGRDLLSRVIHGGRVSLFVAFLSVLIGTSVGFTWGLASGYFGGRFDLINQRLAEVLISFPSLILAMALAVALGASMWTVIVAISVTTIAPAARIVRSVVLSVKETLFVEAAQAVGATPLRVMAFHIAPQCVAPFLIVFTGTLGAAILTEAALSFLGVGIPPPTPTWGAMLGEASAILTPRWWFVFFPGLFITISVLAFNLFGDGLRDLLDPRLRGFA